MWSEYGQSLRAIDLIEGAAVHATYRSFTSPVLGHPDSPEGFEDHLWMRYRDPSRDHYTRAYRLARDMLGHSAYFAFGKLTYLALLNEEREEPTERFCSLLAALRGRRHLDLRSTSVRELARLCGQRVELRLGSTLRSMGWVRSGQDRPRTLSYLDWLMANETNATLGATHPVLGPYLALLAHAPDGFDVLEFGAEPLRDGILRSAGSPKSSNEAFDCFLQDFMPPLTLFTDGAIATGLAEI